MAQVIVAPFWDSTCGISMKSRCKMLRNAQKPLLILLAFTLLGCHTTTKRYTTNPDFQTGNIQATRHTGVNKPGGKPFPITRWTFKKDPDSSDNIAGLYGGTLLASGLLAGAGVSSKILLGGIALLGPTAVDLAITPFTFLYGYNHFDILDVNGTLQGKVRTENKPPASQPMNMIISSQTIPIQVGSDGKFTLPLNLQNELLHNGMIGFSITFPWKDTLAAKGEVLKPTPDTLDYTLRLKPDRIMELLDSSKQPISSLDITLAYEKVSDENRKRELAKKRTVEYKQKAIKDLVDSYTARLPSIQGQLEPIETGIFSAPVAVPCTDSYYTHWINWLNQERTKAKVVLTLHGKYPAHISRSGNTTYIVKDYIGGEFLCEQMPSGDWQIAK